MRAKHIFIVEDNEIYSMLLDYILSKDSIHKFVSFKSGEECIANLYLEPDIIILDLGLPGMDGYETLLQIKRTNPKVHVVILTHNEDKKIRKQLLKAGADDYILKQGHGELQIMSIIDAIIEKDELEKSDSSVSGIKSFFHKIFFLGSVAALVAVEILLAK